MGYRRIPTIYTLDEIPGEDGLVVRMKTISFGKVRRLIRLMGSDDGDEDVMEEISAQVVKNLVSWNLEDDDGPVEPDVAGVDAQDFDLVLKIVNSWLDAITGVGKDLGKDSSSGEKFPGQPLTMEAL